jgi:hypothetical protein
MSKPVLLTDVTPTRLKAVKTELQASGHLIVLDDGALTNKNFNEEAVRALVAKMYPKIDVRILTHQDHPEVLFAACGTLPGEVDKLEAKFFDNNLAQFLARRFGVEGVTKAFKQLLIERLSRHYYMIQMAKQLKDGVLIAPLISDSLIPSSWHDGLSISPGIERLSKFRWFKNTALLWLRLGHLIITRINKMRLTEKPITTDYAFQVVWGGVGDMGPDAPRHLNRFGDDFLLDGKNIRFDNSLFVLGAWERNLNASAKKRLHDNIAQAQGHLLRETELGPTLKHWLTRRIGLYVRHAFPSLLWMTLTGGKSGLILEQSLRLIRHIDLYDLFVLKARPKVFLGLDDQGVQHMARTMIFEKYGLKNVGLGHSIFGGPQTIPSISFLHFHQYLTISPAIPPLFAPFWDKDKIYLTGLPRGDLVHESLTDETRRILFRKTVGGKKIILALPCGQNRWHLMDRVRGFYENLNRLAMENKDWRIVLKPRMDNIVANWHQDLALSILDPAIQEGRIFVMDETFDTQELIAFCDLVVGAMASSAVGEALSIGRKTFCYNFNGLDHYNSYRMFDERLAANGPAEMSERIDYFDNDPTSTDLIEKAGLAFTPVSSQNSVERIRAALINACAT